MSFFSNCAFLALRLSVRSFKCLLKVKFAKTLATFRISARDLLKHHITMILLLIHLWYFKIKAQEAVLIYERQFFKIRLVYHTLYLRIFNSESVHSRNLKKIYWIEWSSPKTSLILPRTKNSRKTIKRTIAVSQKIKQNFEYLIKDVLARIESWTLSSLNRLGESYGSGKAVFA